MSKAVQFISAFIKNCTGFENQLKNVKIISAGSGSCVAEYKVEDEVANVVGTMHGGYTATLIDAISSYGLHADEMVREELVPSVSVNLNITYIKAAKVGEVVVIDSKTIKAGKSMAYLECVLKNKETGDLLVKGIHTKFFLRR